MMERSQYAGPTQVTVWAYVLLVWFSLVLGGSLLGAFVSSHAQPPLALGMAVVVPIALFLLGYFWSAGFRQFVSSMSAQTITRIQIYRVLGVVFLILYSRGLLPGVFALPAGWETCLSA